MSRRLWEPTNDSSVVVTLKVGYRVYPRDGGPRGATLDGTQSYNLIRKTSGWKYSEGTNFHTFHTRNGRPGSGLGNYSDSSGKYRTGAEDGWWRGGRRGGRDDGRFGIPSIQKFTQSVRDRRSGNEVDKQRKLSGSELRYGTKGNGSIKDN